MCTRGLIDAQSASAIRTSIVVHLGVRTNAFTRLKTAVGLSFEIARLTRTIAG